MAEIHRRCEHKVKGFIFNRTQSHELVEEYYQETVKRFMKAYSARSVDLTAQLSTLLCTIAVSNQSAGSATNASLTVSFLTIGTPM